MNVYNKLAFSLAYSRLCSFSQILFPCLDRMESIGDCLDFKMTYLSLSADIKRVRDIWILVSIVKFHTFSFALGVPD